MKRGTGRIAGLMVVGLLLSAGIGKAGTPLDVPALCVARGKLIATAANEVRFNADGVCNGFTAELRDQHGGPCCPYPQWTGGCDIGPGPIPPIVIVITYKDPLGTVVSKSYTRWHFSPLNPVGPAINSVSLVTINEAFYGGGGVLLEGGQIGSGVLLTRLGGACSVGDPKKAGAWTAFEIAG